MLSPNELASFANACRYIADRSAEPDGFVRTQTLLNAFNAELMLRPLLVEAMVTSAKRDLEKNIDHRWSVLVDSDIHKISQDDLNSESSKRPLSVRFRNTIAHELVHTIPFNLTHFGIELSRQKSSNQSLKALVEDVESDTEKLSPLLLISERSLRNSISRLDTLITVRDVIMLAAQFGVSRPVFINRLLLTRQFGDPLSILELPPLKNMAVGMGAWKSDGTAVFRKWPLFMNFDKAVTPDFLLHMKQQDYLPLNTISPSGVSSVDEKMLGATFNAPTSMSSTKSSTMPIHLSIERKKNLRESAFIFVAKRQ